MQRSEFGGEDKGPRPKPLMLAALGGCTGMDVVSILKKMRVDFKSLNVIVEGELSEEHPRRFTKMHVIYEVEGENLPMDKIQKAVSLSRGPVLRSKCRIQESHGNHFGDSLKSLGRKLRPLKKLKFLISGRSR